MTTEVPPVAGRSASPVGEAERPALEFWRSWPTFPLTRTDDEQLMVTVDRGSDSYEFGFTDVGSARGSRRIAVQVHLFSDSWRAFTDLPDLFAWLASRHGQSTTLDDVVLFLLGVGAVDVTARYARSHTHAYACLGCGEVLP